MDNINLDDIVEIDFATRGRSYFETVGNTRFDGVYSSHCIEHTYDVIGHLIDVSNILKNNGYYVIVIPDKDNNFDYFRAPSTFREAYQVFKGEGINYIR